MLRSFADKIIYGSHKANQRYQTLNLIELNAAAVVANVKLLQRQHPGFSVMPVLKANAYGHGLSEMAKILNDASCEFLAVDGYFEAAKIRYITKHRILVLGYIGSENVRLLDTKRCSFVVQDIAGLEAFARLNKSVKIHIELNTGMNRLGLRQDEFKPYLKILKKYSQLKLEGIMTHLADADNPRDNSFTGAQVKLFDELVEKVKWTGFNPKVIHVAQTAGSAKVKSKYANGLRLGIGLYGINPLNSNDGAYKELAGLQPVLALKSTIVKVINLKPGDKVSYNGIFTANQPTRIGVLPLGYYEGVPRELSNVGCATSENQILPIVGRVCMNHTMIDLKNSRLNVGDSVTVISANKSDSNSIQNIANNHNLFSYSLLTGLTSSVRRKIV
ncbi:MAG: alanine racemase [Candidatus Saccharimonadales bacterium]